MNGRTFVAMILVLLGAVLFLAGLPYQLTL